MKKLAIAKDLTLPIDAATQTFAFIARKGAGKTYTAGKLVELLVDAGVQTVILDTVGNWYGLRLAADGQGKGLDIPVLGGLRGDIPLDAAGGALIADIVVDTGRSLVLDASQWSKADRQRFATAFGERLWLRKKAERQPSPVHLVLEESQLIIPQDVRGDSARMFGVFEEIIRLGRNYGIGVSMITQRPQSVNKEVLNMAECLFVGQINGPQERDALKKWITQHGGDVDLVNELPALPIGTFYCWSPQWLQILQKVAILPKRTLDASATPKVGDKRIVRDLKPLDLTELQSKMAATIEKAKADDPRELRKQLAEAQRMLLRQSNTIGELHKASSDRGEKPEVKSVPALTDADRALLEKLVKRFGEMSSELYGDAVQLSVEMQTSMEELIRRTWYQFEGIHQKARKEFAEKIDSPSVKKLIQKLQALSVTAMLPPAPGRGHNQSTNALRTPSAPPSSRPATPSRPQVARTAPANPDGMGKGQLVVLAAIAQHDAGVTREQLTVLTGYKRSSRDTYLQQLNQRGMIEFTGANISATAAGLDALGPDFERLPTGAALLEHWRRELPQGERVILDALVPAYPNAVTRDALSESTGYKRSSRDTYIQKLAARKLVEADSRGVTASALLFD